MAIKATEIFRKNKKYYDEEARAIVNQGYDPFSMPNLKFTAGTNESIAINEKKGSAIVIAGSGMCTAGRIKHHLKHNLWREGASMVIVGFQAKGTTGRQIVDGAKQVKIFRENVAVKAKVFTIGGFSAHADQNDLLEWVGHFESTPRVFVVHGEATASETLAEKIREKFKLEVHVPQWKERLILKPREVSYERAEEPEPLPDVRNMMLNSVIDVEKELKRLRKRISAMDKPDGLEPEEVDRLAFLKEELQNIMP